VERLQALLKPLMLRRLKEGWFSPFLCFFYQLKYVLDVEKSIPLKEETIIEV
jgi:SNF2 family DNA or RNA helicase